MLPKIIVADTNKRDEILRFLGLVSSSTMEYEGTLAKIDELRHFINFGINVCSGSSRMSLVIWDADRLSPECQTVLLKPLEESVESLSLILIVSNENRLLPTVTSRCVITGSLAETVAMMKHWKNVLAGFNKGPGYILSWVDELDRPITEEVLEEVISKLKLGLCVEVNAKRLRVLKMAVDCLSEIRFTNVNHKLALGNFLICSWRLI